MVFGIGKDKSDEEKALKQMRERAMKLGLEEDTRPKPEKKPKKEETPTPEEQETMIDAEQTVQAQEMADYTQRPPAAPETEHEAASKLLDVDARMSVNRVPVKIRDPQLNIVREIMIEVPDGYPEPFNSDIAKANFTEGDNGSVWGNVTLMNFYRMIGKGRGFNLKKICEFHNAQKDSVVNISRGEHGFSAMTMRTNKSVSVGEISHLMRKIKEQKQEQWRKA